MSTLVPPCEVRVHCPLREGILGESVLKPDPQPSPEHHPHFQPSPHPSYAHQQAATFHLPLAMTETCQELSSRQTSRGSGASPHHDYPFSCFLRATISNAGCANRQRPEQTSEEVRKKQIKLGPSREGCMCQGGLELLCGWTRRRKKSILESRGWLPLKESKGGGSKGQTQPLAKAEAADRSPVA